MSSNPYQDYVQRLAQVMDEGRMLPFGGLPVPSAEPPVPGAPLVLILAPHPDDECIVGALPLRLLRERGHRVAALPVTLGSRADRQTARLAEMRGACDFLGFDLIPARENGLTDVNPAARERNPATWALSVSLLAGILADLSPATILLPHEQDQNSTHQGTHLLALDALRHLPPGFACHVVETEFWAPMRDPNLMVESSCADVGDLMAALSFHRGEVERNPYHLRLPAWMSDNVRRGSELVGAQGGASPDFRFATLYRVRRWEGGRLAPALPAGCVQPVGPGLEAIFG